jgi:response regulator NasT
MTTQRLRIALAEDETDTREYLQELLTRMGHEAVAVATGKQLVELCRASPPDLVLTDIKMPDLDGIDAAIEVEKGGGGFPVILVSAYQEAELLDRAAGAGNVMAYLVKPVSSADVEAAVHLALRRFEKYREVRQEADSLRQALEDRKLVERAKGAVMKRLDLGEEEAFRRMKEAASRHNCKLAEVAKDLLAAEEVFRQAEGEV